MAIALAVSGFAFAAFCIWLGVRIVNRRERWAKRLAVGLVLLLIAYPLSFRPGVLDHGSAAISNRGRIITNLSPTGLWPAFVRMLYVGGGSNWAFLKVTRYAWTARCCATETLAWVPSSRHRNGN